MVQLLGGVGATVAPRECRAPSWSAQIPAMWAVPTDVRRMGVDQFVDAGVGTVVGSCRRRRARVPGTYGRLYGRHLHKRSMRDWLERRTGVRLMQKGSSTAGRVPCDQFVKTAPASAHGLVGLWRRHGSSDCARPSAPLPFRAVALRGCSRFAPPFDVSLSCPCINLSRHASAHGGPSGSLAAVSGRCLWVRAPSSVGTTSE